jgi:hypothetical protein
MAQYARPDSDITLNNWDDPSWSTIDEETPNDGDYTDQVGTGELVVGLSDVTDPESSSGHVFRWRAKSTGSGQKEGLSCSLYEGTTLRAASPSENLDRTEFTTFTYTLSSAEADSIGDYSNLRLRFYPVCGSTETVAISWAEFEVPDAAVSYEYTGNIPVSVLPDAPTASLEKSFAGSISITLVNSVITIVEGIYVGSVPISITPSAVRVVERVYSGQIEISSVPCSISTLEYPCTGTISVSITPQGVYSLELEYSYEGNIPISIISDTPAGIVDMIYGGQLAISITPSITALVEMVYSGSIPITILPESGTAEAIAYVGSLDLTLSIESMAVMEYVGSSDLLLGILPESEALLEAIYQGLVSIVFSPNSDYSLDEEGEEIIYQGLIDITLLPESEVSLNYIAKGEIRTIFIPTSTSRLSIPSLRQPVVGLNVGQEALSKSAMTHKIIEIKGQKYGG